MALWLGASGFHANDEAHFRKRTRHVMLFDELPQLFGKLGLAGVNREMMAAQAAGELVEQLHDNGGIT
ncbi:hypothetical protein NIHE141904_44120 [Enterobacter hormaechei]|nr:hypothetical protein NIHE141904_44120 [Enterobacter hormaechei]